MAGTYAGTFEMQSSNGYFTGAFQLQASRIVGRQSDAFGNVSPLDLEVRVYGDILELFGQDIFGNRTRQVWERYSQTGSR